MQIDDRGLGPLVYHLMTGGGKYGLYPGLNVLVKDETGPGGLLAGYEDGQKKAVKRSLEQDSADERFARILTLLGHQRFISRKLALQMFRYGLMLSPLLQLRQAPDGDPDHQALANVYWTGSQEMDEEDCQAVRDMVAFGLRRLDSRLPIKEPEVADLDLLLESMLADQESDPPRE